MTGELRTDEQAARQNEVGLFIGSPTTNASKLPDHLLPQPKLSSPGCHHCYKYYFSKPQLEFPSCFRPTFYHTCVTCAKKKKPCFDIPARFRRTLNVLFFISTSEETKFSDDIIKLVYQTADTLFNFVEAHNARHFTTSTTIQSSMLECAQRQENYERLRMNIGFIGPQIPSNVIVNDALDQLVWKTIELKPDLQKQIFGYEDLEIGQI